MARAVGAARYFAWPGYVRPRLHGSHAGYARLRLGGAATLRSGSGCRGGCYLEPMTTARAWPSAGAGARALRSRPCRSSSSRSCGGSPRALEPPSSLRCSSSRTSGSRLRGKKGESQGGLGRGLEVEARVARVDQPQVVPTAREQDQRTAEHPASVKAHRHFARARRCDTLRQEAPRAGLVPAQASAEPATSPTSARRCPYRERDRAARPPA
jgi:hypothetical protein